jgi:uncharacterized glyoxalase superfamily protein PhnB
MSAPRRTTATIVPGLRYRDAPKAIDWLCRAFGFEKHLVVPNDDGTIAHAQLVFGNGMIMLGSAGKHGNEYDELVKPPAQVGGVATQGLYVIVEDADAHLALARAAGAEIVMDLSDKDYGGRDFTCRDLEGNVWTFGTYDPWAAEHDVGVGG